MTADQLHHRLISDGELTEDEISLDIAAMLRDAGPWGQAFPEPLFDDTFRIVEQRLVGDKHLKLRLMKDTKMIEARFKTIKKTGTYILIDLHMPLKTK